MAHGWAKSRAQAARYLGRPSGPAFVLRIRWTASIGWKETSLRNITLSYLTRPSAPENLSSGLSARFRSSARKAIRFVRVVPSGIVTLGRPERDMAASLTIDFRHGTLSLNLASAARPFGPLPLSYMLRKTLSWPRRSASSINRFPQSPPDRWPSLS